MEVMSLDEMPSKDHHHRSSFLPHFHMVEEKFTSDVSSDIVSDPQSSILTCDVESECNLSKITNTIPVDISMQPGIPENI